MQTTWRHALMIGAVGVVLTPLSGVGCRDQPAETPDGSGRDDAAGACRQSVDALQAVGPPD